MGFHWPIFRKPEPVLDDAPERGRGGQFTASPKTRRRNRRYASVVAQLAVYKAMTTPEQREADAAAFFARRANEDDPEAVFRKAVKLGAWKGLGIG